MGSPIILIFAGEEVPRMALRVLHATHRTSEHIWVFTVKRTFNAYTRIVSVRKLAYKQVLLAICITLRV